MNPAIIIQARENSRRLPNKWSREINGKKLIDIVVDECMKTKLQLIVAIPKGDSKLADYLAGQDILYATGSEHDVLTRFYHIADKWSIDPIIRVCSDAKNIHHELIKQQLENYRKYKHTCYGNFCEVFSFDELEHSYYYDKRPSSREHVSLGMIRDLTVDYEIDLM